MFSYRPQQQLVIYVIEQTLDVELDNPVLFPASPANHVDRV